MTEAHLILQLEHLVIKIRAIAEEYGGAVEQVSTLTVEVHRVSLCTELLSK